MEPCMCSWTHVRDRRWLGVLLTRADSFEGWRNLRCSTTTESGVRLTSAGEGVSYGRLPEPLGKLRCAAAEGGAECK